jgi:hypothetical protein
MSSYDDLVLAILSLVVVVVSLWVVFRVNPRVPH